MTVRVLLGLRFVEEELGPGPSQQVWRLCDRGEGHGGSSSELHVVVTDDGDVLGHGHSVLPQALDQAEGEEVVGAEHSGRALAPRQAEEPLGRSPAHPLEEAQRTKRNDPRQSRPRQTVGSVT